MNEELKRIYHRQESCNDPAPLFFVQRQKLFRSGAAIK
jgi:hypothetical protein